MGFAVIMFVALMLMSVVMITAITYGVAKDSQTAPLKAKNIYADIKTGQAQTGLTIVNTCLDGSGRYTGGQNPGFHNLNLTVENNGSVVLNSTRVTVLYNTSYINFTVTSAGNVWTPLTNASLVVSNIYLDPNIPPPGPELRLLVAAENGISTIAPTVPRNFTGSTNSLNNSFMFSWNASYDADGIAYYRLYDIASQGNTGQCPPQPYVIGQISGRLSNSSFGYDSLCPEGHCNTDWFYLTAVDNLGNEGIQSRTIKCIPAQSNPCTW